MVTTGIDSLRVGHPEDTRRDKDADKVENKVKQQNWQGVQGWEQKAEKQNRQEKAIRVALA